MLTLYYNNTPMKNFISLIFLTFSFLTYSQNVAPTVADAAVTITEGATGQSINVTVSDDDGDSWTLSVVSDSKRWYCYC